MPKISVIIPIYNVEKYLRECINSVLNQTFSDFELILINDGSPDKSHNICLEYIKKDSRIKYFSQKNQGVSVARNKGLKMASGDYIFIMDSDDTIEKDFLEKAYKNAINNLSDIVVLGEAFEIRMPYPPALPTCAMFFKRSSFKDYGIIFPIGIQPCEDGLFSHQLLALTDKISLEKQIIYNYRTHEFNNHTIINKNCDKTLNQIPKWFEILDKFYTQNNLWQIKSKHLLKFIEHEPFEFRFIDMPFNEQQKEILFNTIHEFIKKHNLQEFLDKSFSKDFQLFVKSKTYKDYKYKLKITKIKDCIFSIKNTKDRKHIIFEILGLKFCFKVTK